MGSTPINVDDPTDDANDKERERQEAIAKLQKLIDEGFVSGISMRSMDDIRREARRRAGMIEYS
jgi:uncharacterized protein YoaH (UPF0181 family)